jgi:hypothetical protein
LFSLLEEPRVDGATAEVIEELMGQDLDALSPLEALNLLSELQRKLRDER